MLSSFSRTHKIDIIIPVYRGLETTRNCLESVLSAENKTPFELIVIEDCSPEKGMRDYLKGLAAIGKITLTVHEQNLGFVKTVNEGMRKNPARDVILLNSDTLVPDFWIDRICALANKHPRAGSITPFSNNATICSYPRFCHPNPNLDLDQIQELNRIFSETNALESVELPTAVGFCMYIRRSCLQDVGLFDEENFGRGYGEENDFCMRATQKSWKHLLCADTYVAHVGGVSFAETQTAQMKQAEKVLVGLHPSYPRNVHDHFVKDPARPYRLAVDLKRLQERKGPKILFITHQLGGGIQTHIDELTHLMGEQALFLTLAPTGSPYEVVLKWGDSREAFQLYFKFPNDLEKLKEILVTSGVSRLHFHHTLGVDSLLWQMPELMGVPFDVSLHDFFLLCPRIHLSHLEGRILGQTNERFCGFPDEAGCNACLNKRPYAASRDIHEWRETYHSQLMKASRVFAPSQYVANLFQKTYPDLAVQVAPHPDSETENLHQPVSCQKLNDKAPLKIALLGTLGVKKGLLILEQAVQSTKKQNAKLEFHLFGKHSTSHSENLSAPYFIDHGSYGSDEELNALLKKFSPDIIWFPGQIPETYSYTLSAALGGGYPVASTDLGAIAERIQGRPYSWLLPWNTSGQDWVKFFSARREEWNSFESTASWTRKVEKAYWTYTKDYLTFERETHPISTRGPEPLWKLLKEHSVSSKEALENSKFSLKNSLLKIHHKGWTRPFIQAMSPALRQKIKTLLFSRNS